jgi:hypothetical protein
VSEAEDPATTVTGTLALTLPTVAVIVAPPTGPTADTVPGSETVAMVGALVENVMV